MHTQAIFFIRLPFLFLKRYIYHKRGKCQQMPIFASKLDNESLCNFDIHNSLPTSQSSYLPLQHCNVFAFFTVCSREKSFILMLIGFLSTALSNLVQ